MFSELVASSIIQGKDTLMNGVYSAIVTDNKDPKSFGRVKVKIPIIDDQKEFDWMRVSTLVAGQGKGTLFVPEIGDEVLVAFLMGDIKSPIVIGCLWAEKQLPEGFNEANDIKKIKTKHGHEIIFNDNSKEANVTIKTKKGQKLDMSEKTDEIVLTTADSKHKLTLNEKSGSVEIKSGNTVISLNQKGEVKIEGSNSVSVQGGQVKLQATSNLELKANANMTLQAGGMMQIKGSMIKLN